MSVQDPFLSFLCGFASGCAGVIGFAFGALMALAGIGDESLIGLAVAGLIGLPIMAAAIWLSAKLLRYLINKFQAKNKTAIDGGIAISIMLCILGPVILSWYL